jgi:hypothetical protein
MLLSTSSSPGRYARPCDETVPEKINLKDLGVSYHPNVVAFANHPRNLNVGFVPLEEHYQYVDPVTNKLRRAKGITKLLKDTFYKDFKPVYAPSPSTNRKKKRMKRGVKLTGQQLLAQKLADDRIKGLKLGTTVHQELCDWARLPSIEAWRCKHPRPNMYTVKVIRALHRLRIEPLYGEWPIFADWGIATGIDIVGASADYRGRLVLIEVKTGYEGYFKRGNGNMTRTPMKRVINSPMNQALLQCLIGRAILEREYGIEGVIGIVIRVHREGVNVYPIPETFLRRQNTIYRALRDHASEIREHQSRKRKTQKPSCKNNKTTRYTIVRNGVEITRFY